MGAEKATALTEERHRRSTAWSGRVVLYPKALDGGETDKRGLRLDSISSGDLDFRKANGPVVGFRVTVLFVSAFSKRTRFSALDRLQRYPLPVRQRQAKGRCWV